MTHSRAEIRLITIFFSLTKIKENKHLTFGQCRRYFDDDEKLSQASINVWLSGAVILENSGLVRDGRVLDASGKITSEGALFCLVNEFEALNSISDFPELTEGFLENMLSLREPRSQFAPASNRMVSLKDNQIIVENAIAFLEDADEAIRGSNLLSEEEKSVWSNLLAQGKERLRQPSTYIFSITALIIKPLYDAYSSAIEESAKPIIKAALLAVQKLIGI